jgi:hypothetical protein
MDERPYFRQSLIHRMLNTQPAMRVVDVMAEELVVFPVEFRASRSAAQIASNAAAAVRLKWIVRR